jgi:hypothetical protein
MMRHLYGLVACVLGCAATARVPGIRYVNGPITTLVDDRRDVPKRPAQRESQLMLYYFDGVFARLITRALELPRPQRALGVNALDEVPDSTWFTNRIGVRNLSLDEVRRGPTSIASPEAHKPWTIKSAKQGGKSIGFVIEDARGEKFLLKFDEREYPEAETAADVIVNRLLWACGYNVPEDHVVYLRRDELIVADDATTKDDYGKKRKLHAAEVDRKLALVHADEQGRIRALVSHMLAGKPLGGHADEGVRADDPNDRIPHELRRDLRGMQPIFAWLDHVDVKEHNSLDMWVTDAADPARHYVKHYLLDFGKSLGVMALTNVDLRRGHSYYLDYGEMLASLVSAGLGARPWENRPAPRLRGVGVFEAKTFDPGAWKPSTQAYVPFLAADRFDGFWGAKLIIRFTREHVRAAVEAARLSDARAADYMVDTLVARQRAAARYWFERVAPIDRVEVQPTRDGHALCFDDLALAHELGSITATRYTLRAYDRAGHALAESTVLRPGPQGHTCTGTLPIAHVGEAYTMVRIDVTRPDLDPGAGVIIHLARDPKTQVPRVIGLWRL